MQPTAKHLMQGLEGRARKGFQGYPMAIIAFYGPNDRIATKAVIGIVMKAGGSPEQIKKWLFENGDLRKDVPSIKELFRYIESHNVRSVALTPGIYDCPHEAGVDYPQGGACPQCLYWSNIKKPDLFKAKAAASQDRPQQILEIITEAARNKKTLYHGDVMKTVGLDYKEALHRKTFTAALREAARKSELFEHGLLLSALLVYKIQFIPDDDFFDMAHELGLFTPNKDSKTVFFKDQMEGIFKFYT
jgi:hypothetical protein